MASKDSPAITKLPSISALPVGVVLQEFEITGVLGEGGFGIVYLARDRLLGRDVAIKEYMPASLAARGNDRGVVVRSRSHQQTFEAGLKSFIAEARLLAQFKHAALVEIFRFWEQNGTAYMAMPFYRGRTLKQHLKEHNDSVNEMWLRELLIPLLDGLEHLHSAHCYHRDIAPDNILILENGKPLLLDFGAARRIVGDVTSGLTVILKPGYAPVEQYADDASVAQGPWTDVYALAAICYLTITRASPPASVTRLMRDPLTALASQNIVGYSKQFLQGVDSGLAVRPENRPQSIAEFRRLLGLDTPLVAPIPAVPVAAAKLDLMDPAVSVRVGGTGSAPTSVEQSAASKESARFPFLRGGTKTSADNPNDSVHSAEKNTLVSSSKPSKPAKRGSTGKKGMVVAQTALDEDTVVLGALPPAPASDVHAIDASDATTVDDAGETTGAQSKRGGLVAAVAGIAIAAIAGAYLYSSMAQSPNEREAKSAANGNEVAPTSGTPPDASPKSMTGDPATPGSSSATTTLEPPPSPSADERLRQTEEAAKLDAEKLAADEKAKADEKQKADEKLRAVSGVVMLNIVPWGEVYVDGQSRGVSPPRKRLSLVEGRYSVMVRNGAFEPFLTTIEVKRGEQLQIKHEFK